MANFINYISLPLKHSVVKPLPSTNQIFHLDEITKQAINLFEDEDTANRWLSTPKVGLDHKTPLEVMTTLAGAEKVSEMLYRAEYGMYA